LEFFLHLEIIHFFGSSFIKKGRGLKIIFYNKLLFKDIFVIVFFFGVLGVSFFTFLEDDNFLIVDLVASPLHIKPEWYFLFVYAVLRRVFNKGLGVIIIIFMLLLILGLGLRSKIIFRFFRKFFSWSWLLIIMILTFFRRN